MTIGEGISTGGNAYLKRKEEARQFNAALAEKKRQADLQARVALAQARLNAQVQSEKISEDARQFDASQELSYQGMAVKQDQWNTSHAWDDALNQQKYETEALRQKEISARLSHYQELEAQTRQRAADLKNARNTAIKDMFWMARNNGGYLTSPELLGEFSKRFDAPDLAGITTAGFFYNEDGSVKSPQNDDNKPARFGMSYNYVDPQTGKIAVDEDGNRAEKVFVPKFQDEWVLQGQFWDGGSTKVGSSGLTFEQRQSLENQKIEGRKDLKQMDVDAKKYTTDANNTTRLKIADIGAELKRMGYEVDEKKLEEAIRHNKATEAIADSRVAETSRHNQVNEEITGRRVDETVRHNGVMETQGQKKIDETARHNQATEQLNKDKLEWRRSLKSLNETLDKPENNAFTADKSPEEIKALKQRAAYYQQFLEKGSLTSENYRRVREEYNRWTAELFGGPDETTPKENRPQTRSVAPPTNQSAPKGAMAFGGYAKKKDGTRVPFWYDAEGNKVFGTQM